MKFEVNKTLKDQNMFSLEGYHVWGATMQRTYDGKCHMIFSMWPKEKGFSAWVTHSTLGYAVSDKPDGPYTFVEQLDREAHDWDKDVIHNPVMIKYEDKYYLYYMGNYGDGTYWSHRNNQRIGVAVADHPSGPWETFSKPIIDVSKGHWDHLMVSNPTVTIKDDQIVMVYKGVGQGELPQGGPVVLGTAVSNHPLGPFNKIAGPIMTNPENDWSVEDPYIWHQEKFYALVKDFQGYFTGHGHDTVALFESNDACNWHVAESAFAFDRTVILPTQTKEVSRLERPQIWLKDGKPSILFCAMKDGDATFNVQFTVD